jgi:protein SCO1/2
VLSFDPRDTVADVAMLTHHHELPDEDRHWIVAVADPADVRRLADAVGFWWAWDGDRQQFDHPAMLAGIRDGRLRRLLAGGSVSAARLNELMREMSGEFVRSYPLPDRILFRCFQYDPATGRLTLDWGFAVLLLPVVATTVTTSLMFAAGARMRRRGQGQC